MKIKIRVPSVNDFSLLSLTLRAIKLVQQLVSARYNRIMAHFHEDSDSYYLDQLCLIALSGAFGGVCLSLFFWQKTMLELMLGPQFHAFVLASGILLVGLALIRGTILWKSAGNSHSHHH